MNAKPNLGELYKTLEMRGALSVTESRKLLVYAAKLEMHVEELDLETDALTDALMRICTMGETEHFKKSGAPDEYGAGKMIEIAEQALGIS